MGCVEGGTPSRSVRQGGVRCWLGPVALTRFTRPRKKKGLYVVSNTFFKLWFYENSKPKIYQVYVGGVSRPPQTM